jgi:hypothetical protein
VAIALTLYSDCVTAIGKSVGDWQEDHLAAFREEGVLGRTAVAWRNGERESGWGMRAMSTGM